MGFVSFKAGLQTRISTNTEYRHTSNLCKCKRYSYFNARGRKVIAKRRDRTCTTYGNSQRFLQYIFLCNKKDRGFKTSDKSTTSEQISPNSTFQNGLSYQGHKSSQQELRQAGHYTPVASNKM